MENTNRTQLSQGSKANRLNNFLLEKGKEMNLWGSLIMVLGGGIGMLSGFNLDCQQDATLCIFPGKEDLQIIGLLTGILGAVILHRLVAICILLLAIFSYIIVVILPPLFIFIGN